MKNFACEKCGYEIIEDDKGKRIIFCEHYAPQGGMKVQSTFFPKDRHTAQKTNGDKTKLN